MKYYSTNGKIRGVSLEEAVVNGLASDKGLFMPERIPHIPDAFFRNIGDMSLQEISYAVANTLFGEDVPSEILKDIVTDALNFKIPAVKVTSDIYSLELFHGPTLAFKDVGARFMARLLGYFNHRNNDGQRLVNVLVATSGDTGSAVANGFLGVEGVRVFVLYPRGKVSTIQESQFTTLEQNIVALEVDGTFDDCQAMVKDAFMDKELNEKLLLTSANSINLARFLPQMFYYFYGYSQLLAKDERANKHLVFAVPSGNLGNLIAGLFAKRMGLPISRFIAANNRNDVFFKYLESGEYHPRSSVQTIANAMDVGNPSNFARILDLYGHDYNAIRNDISGITLSDDEISETIADTYANDGYLLDPHGATGFYALSHELRPEEVGMFIETAHPAKFKDTVDDIVGEKINIPLRLQDFMKGEKQTISLPPTSAALKDLLLHADS